MNQHRSAHLALRMSTVGVGAYALEIAFAA
jgi:hypothetical protein